MNKKFSVMIIFSVVFVLGMFFSVTTPVFAEGEEPPVEVVVTESSPPAEQTGSTPVPEETPLSPLPDEGSPPEIVEEPPALGEVLVPEDNTQPTENLATVAVNLSEQDLTLSDEKGELLSLASQAVVTGADPWFRVGTLIYRFINGDCSSVSDPYFYCEESTTPIQAALDYISGNGTLPSDRTLYIEADDYVEDVELDGTLGPLSQMTRIIGNDDSDTVIDGDVEIHHTVAGFTLQGLTIIGNLWMHDNRGTLTLRDLSVSNDDGDGIVVETQSGAINLVDVHADNNLATGSYLDNFLVIAPVLVTNSTFNYNNNHLDDQAGLFIYSRGPVTLNGVSARFNKGDGIGIETRAPVTVRNSIVTHNEDWGLWAEVSVSPGNILIENTESNVNGEDGFWFMTPGSVTLNNVRAISNSNSGLFIPDDGANTITINNSQFWANSNHGVDVHSRSGFTGTTIGLSDNIGDGIRVFTRGNILLDHVVACSNDGDGVFLLNAMDGGYGTITIDDAMGMNEIYENDENGLVAISTNTITINNLFSHDNGAVGVSLHNNDPSKRAGVNINDLTVMSNYGRGIAVESIGAINWRYGGVSWNGYSADPGTSAAYLDNQNGVSPANVTLTNVHINDNYSGGGLEVFSRGTISLSDVDSHNNYDGHGVYLYNLNGTAGVSVTGTNTRSFNDNNGYGLDIYSNGPVTLRNIQANNNNGYGAYMDLQTARTGTPVTMTNVDFNNNRATGLYVLARGPITITNINAGNNNDGDDDMERNDIGGAYLQNTAGSGAVSILRTNPLWSNWFGSNEGDGLTIIARGNIIVTRLSASSNAGTGAQLDNCLYNGSDTDFNCYGAGTVSINNPIGYASDFNNNWDSGLLVSSRYAITAGNIQAGNNGGNGASIDNNWANSSGGITLTASGGYNNDFNNNGYRGLGFYSRGAITINRVSANDNGEFGAVLTNSGALTPLGVTVTVGEFSRNHQDGLRILSRGQVNVTDARANENDVISWGMNLGESVRDRITDQNVSEGDTWWFTVDTEQDVEILLDSVQFDAYLELWEENGTSAIDDNDDCDVGETNACITAHLAEGRYYVIARSSGADQTGHYLLSIADDDRNHFYRNGASGIDVSTDVTGGVGGVTVISSTLERVNFNNNSSTGILVQARGGIRFENLDVSNNGGYGAYIDAHNAGLGAASTLLNVGFNNNRMTGFYLLARGPIIATNMDAGNNTNGDDNMQNNGIGGAYMDNTAGSGAVSILRTNPLWSNWFGSNEGDGLTILARGNIIVTRLSASSNAGTGTQLDNCLYNGSDTDFNCYGAGTVSINNPIGYASDFNNNWDSGLLVSSRYAITAGNIQASNNGGHGAQLDNNWTNSSGPVTLTASTGFNNDFSGNGNRGLGVYSRGAITVNRVSANDNGAFGTVLSNSGALTPLGVTVNTGEFSRNHQDGLRITSRGQVSVTDARANENDILSTGLTLGESVRERITDQNVSVGDTWWFNVDTEQDVEILLDSVQFDAYLELWEENGTSAIDDNDDCDVGETNACITAHLAEGRYYVIARSSGADQTGHYLLSIADDDRNHFYRNGASGIDVSTDVTGGAGGVTIVSSTVERVSFNDNSSTGILVHARGAIRLANIDASNNGGYGAYIDAHNANSGAVSTLLNVGFNNNRMTGLHLVTRGPITATNIDTDHNNDGDDSMQNNGIGGAYMDNTAGSGAVSILRTNPLWSNWFGNNEGIGLFIKARGNISLTRVTANNNASGGAVLDNCLWSGSELDTTCTGTGTITMNISLGYSNNFDNNWGIGLKAASRGAITATNITGSNNGSGGAQLFNRWSNASGSVTINALTGHITDLSNNGGYGLEVRSMGAITVNRVMANNNGFMGALLSNYGALTALPVTVNGIDFSNNHNDGLNITSRGQVTLTDVSANGNDIVQSPNIDLQTSVNECITDQNVSTGDKWWFTVDTGQNVEILMDSDDLDAYLELRSDTDTVINYSNDYGGSTNSRIYQYLAAGRYYVLAQSSGLDQTGNYLLSLNDSSRENFDRNGANGVDISTNVAGGVGGVTINETALDGLGFSNNSSTGILIHSKNAISIRNVHADDNGGYGAVLNNCLYDDGLGSCTGTGGVTVSGYSNSFNNNVQTGLSTHTTGNISLAEISSSGNRVDGAYLSNYLGAGNVTITSTHPEVNWVNEFSSNGDGGLELYTRGTITINRLWALNNTNGDGVYAYSAGAVSPRSVTISNSMAYFNSHYGFILDVNGSITLNNVKASFNSNSGALLRNYSTQGITILNGIYNRNGDYGVQMRTTGNVLMNHIEASENSYDGVLIGLRTDAVVTEAAGSVTLLNTMGMNWFIDNYGDGIQVNASGAVPLTGVNALFNGGDGVDIMTAGTITMLNSQLEYNRYHGIAASSGGLMNFNTLRSYNNSYDKSTDSFSGGYDGANLKAANGSITFLNSALSDNGGSGIEADVNLLSGYNLFTVNTTYYGNNMEDGGYPDIDKY